MFLRNLSAAKKKIYVAESMQLQLTDEMPSMHVAWQESLRMANTSTYNCLSN
jgi:hypothetical protein